jgi:hypothetical protein
MRNEYAAYTKNARTSGPIRRFYKLHFNIYYSTFIRCLLSKERNVFVNHNCVNGLHNVPQCETALG